MRLEAEALRGLGGQHHLLDRPFLPLGRTPVELRRREGVEGLVVSRVHRDELALADGSTSSVIARPWLLAIPISSSQ